jgi:hypothetical protein
VIPLWSPRQAWCRKHSRPSPPGERHHVYKLLKLRVNLSAYDTLKVNGALNRGVAAVSKKGTEKRHREQLFAIVFPLSSGAFDAEEGSP